MSNLVCVAISILVSFVTSAVFITAYKEDISDDLHTLGSRLTDAWTKIHMLEDIQYIHNAKICDMERKLKEMEKVDDGK